MGGRKGTETQWLPVRLGNHNEENGSWEVFWLIRKMVILIYMPCIKNFRATSKNMVCNIWRNERSRKLRFVNFWISFRGTFHRECMAFLQT